MKKTTNIENANNPLYKTKEKTVLLYKNYKRIANNVS